MNKLDIFNEYINIKDKYESLYIFVIYDFTKEEMEDKLIKLLKQLDGISDPRKKGALKSRISDFKNYMEVYSEPMKGVFLVGDTIKYFESLLHCATKSIAFRLSVSFLMSASF